MLDGVELIVAEATSDEFAQTRSRWPYTTITKPVRAPHKWDFFYLLNQEVYHDVDEFAEAMDDELRRGSLRLVHSIGTGGLARAQRRFDASEYPRDLVRRSIDMFRTHPFIYVEFNKPPAEDDSVFGDSAIFHYNFCRPIMAELKIQKPNIPDYRWGSQPERKADLYGAWFVAFPEASGIFPS